MDIIIGEAAIEWQAQHLTHDLACDGQIARR
jgi:hypothetical protein